MNISGSSDSTINGEYYYVRNIQGDIIGLIDKAGTEVVTYTYDAWGKLISIEGNQTVGLKNPYRYRGYRYDTETGLYYLQSRYYNPEWGRFINADALGGRVSTLLSHNMFAYCMNNTINMADPTGHWPNFKKMWEKTKKFFSSVWNSLEIEAGFGAGLGAGGDIDIGSAKLGVEIGAYQERYTGKLDDGKFSVGSTVQAGVGINVPAVINVGTEYKAYNTFKGSKYIDPLYAIGEDPNSQISKSVQVKVLGIDFLSIEPKDIKVGIELKAAVGIEGRLDIQFNVTEFISVFPN